jgi:F0F1-type ATP synthase assembly protein I
MVAEPPSSGPRMSAGLMMLGSEMAGFTVLGVVLDLALGTMPAFTVGLTLLGCVVVFLHLVRMAKAMARRDGKQP